MLARRTAAVQRAPLCGQRLVCAQQSLGHFLLDGGEMGVLLNVSMRLLLQVFYEGVSQVFYKGFAIRFL